jgi:hypothetical protein
MPNSLESIMKNLSKHLFVTLMLIFLHLSVFKVFGQDNRKPLNDQSAARTVFYIARIQANKGKPLNISGDCQNGYGIQQNMDDKNNIFQYEGNFKNGLPDGYGILTYQTGYTADGNFDQGKLNGKFRFLFSKH